MKEPLFQFTGFLPLDEIQKIVDFYTKNLEISGIEHVNVNSITTEVLTKFIEILEEKRRKTELFIASLDSLSSILFTLLEHKNEQTKQKDKTDSSNSLE